MSPGMRSILAVVFNAPTNYVFPAHSDPGAPDSNSAKGIISLSFGKLFEKVSKSFLLVHSTHSVAHIILTACFRACRLALVSAM